MEISQGIKSLQGSFCDVLGPLKQIMTLHLKKEEDCQLKLSGENRERNSDRQ